MKAMVALRSKKDIENFEGKKVIFNYRFRDPRLFILDAEHPDQYVGYVSCRWQEDGDFDFRTFVKKGRECGGISLNERIIHSWGPIYLRLVTAEEETRIQKALHDQTAEFTHMNSSGLDPERFDAMLRDLGNVDR